MPKLFSKRRQIFIKIMCLPSPNASPYSTDDKSDDGTATNAPGDVDSIENNIMCHGTFNHEEIINQDYDIKYNPSFTSSPNASFGEADASDTNSNPDNNDSNKNGFIFHGEDHHQLFPLTYSLSLELLDNNHDSDVVSGLLCLTGGSNS